MLYTFVIPECKVHYRVELLTSGLTGPPYGRCRPLLSSQELDVMSFCLFIVYLMAFLVGQNIHVASGDRMICE
jgi:hypothetical protein